MDAAAPSEAVLEAEARARGEQALVAAGAERPRKGFGEKMPLAVFACPVPPPPPPPVPSSAWLCSLAPPAAPPAR
jgi:hypothetical protein